MCKLVMALLWQDFLPGLFLVLFPGFYFEILKFATFYQSNCDIFRFGFIANIGHHNA